MLSDAISTTRLGTFPSRQTIQEPSWAIPSSAEDGEQARRHADRVVVHSVTDQRIPCGIDADAFNEPGTHGGCGLGQRYGQSSDSAVDFPCAEGYSMEISRTYAVVIQNLSEGVKRGRMAAGSATR